VRFTTLLSVELRKSTDTRSGRAVLGLVAGLTAVVLAWKLTHPALDTSFHSIVLGAVSTVAFLAPVVGLMAMTSEWTQRTALTTFTLAPRRGPVIAAKFAAALVLSLALVVVGVVLSAGATLIGGAVHHHSGPLFAGMGGDVRSFAVIVVLQVVMACAFGALAGQTAVALMAFLVAPMVWAAAANDLLHGAAPWFDVFAAYDQLSSDQPLQHIGQSATAIGVWVVVPAVIGVGRALRREVK
jgi:ABC-type transport system involved in multi-copper enzyme maturation permease subunit